MEKATRDRLTGAVILVALLPIVVSELLSGPSEDRQQPEAVVADAGPPMTTYDLALDSSAGDAGSRQRELAATTANETQAIAQAVPPPVTEQAAAVRTEQPAPAPAPAPQAPATPREEERAPAAPAIPTPRTAQPDRAAERAAATPAPAPARPAAATPTASGRWWVQLGSFSSEENAQRLARDLRGKGFSIDVSKVKSGGRDLHRVRAGPEADRGKAVSLRDRLATAGQKGTLVAP